MRRPGPGLDHFSLGVVKRSRCWRFLAEVSMIRYRRKVAAQPLDKPSPSAETERLPWSEPLPFGQSTSGSRITGICTNHTCEHNLLRSESISIFCQGLGQTVPLNWPDVSQVQSLGLRFQVAACACGITHQGRPGIFIDIWPRFRLSKQWGASCTPPLPCNDQFARQNALAGSLSKYVRQLDWILKSGCNGFPVNEWCSVQRNVIRVGNIPLYCQLHLTK